MQNELLLENPADTIDTLTYTEAAQAINVSVASISNWVKTGYLKKARFGSGIERTSFEEFCNNIVGSEKLNARANKQHASIHHHENLSSDIMNRVWENLNDQNYGNSLSKEYEASLSNAYKNKQGVYYTPESICDELLKEVKVNQTTAFCDPCCGSGNFLIAALKRGVSPENISGYDIDPVAVEIAKRRIYDYSGIRCNKIVAEDFLSLNNLGVRYDLVITNPPWGKKHSKQEKESLSNTLGLNQSLDSCSLFAKAIINAVKPGGQIGLLLPESFFNVKSFQEIREIILSQEINFLFDHGKAFDGLVTKATTVIFSKKTKTKGNKPSCIKDKVTTSHDQDAFRRNPFSIINFTISQAEMDVIESMLQRSHVTLKDNAKWGLGIVTGNNKRHTSKTPTQGFIPVLKGSDIKQHNQLKAPSTYVRSDFSEFQQVAPLELYTAPCKIIYKFISSDIVFYYDCKQRFMLNSANMIIVNEHQLASTEKIVGYFNLDLINWFHQKLYDTHKVLRSNLEQVPIYLDYLNSEKNISNETLLNHLQIESLNGTYRLKK
ncbi:MAG: N-6 DNA methylase [Rickettsiales bacterium]|nr:N-6 DNA methylase [Rickettsiales bacterium]